MKIIIGALVIAGAMSQGLAPRALAAHSEFGGLCAEGLAQHQQIQTDCSISAAYNGKLYCFGSHESEAIFFKDPAKNLARANAFYRQIHK